VTGQLARCAIRRPPRAAGRGCWSIRIDVSSSQPVRRERSQRPAWPSDCAPGADDARALDPSGHGPRAAGPGRSPAAEACEGAPSQSLGMRTACARHPLEFARPHRTESNAANAPPPGVLIGASPTNSRCLRKEILLYRRLATTRDSYTIDVRRYRTFLDTSCVTPPPADIPRRGAPRAPVPARSPRPFAVSAPMIPPHDRQAACNCAWR